MCDQYDNRGCEVVDELDITIANLEDDIKVLEGSLTLIADLESKIEMKDLEIERLENKLFKLSSLNVVMLE